MPAAAAYEQELLAYGTQRLQEVEGLQLVGTAREKACVLSFVMEGAHAHDIGTILDDQGIAVRAGHHCTQPVMDRFGVAATARASLAFYNTREEIDRLVEGLEMVRSLFG
jgi:cysteine desulfurase/selenocysteine lyase